MNIYLIYMLYSNIIYYYNSANIIYANKINILYSISNASNMKYSVPWQKPFSHKHVPFLFIIRFFFN